MFPLTHWLTTKKEDKRAYFRCLRDSVVYSKGFSALHFFLAKSLIQKSAHVCPKYERGKRRFVTPAPPASASASPAAASAEISTQRDLAGA